MKATIPSAAASLIVDATYESVSWHQEFIDENGCAMHSYEFRVPPPTIAVGDFVEFAFSNGKGKVTAVRHRFTDSMRSGYVDHPHLRHFIEITIDTNPDE